MNRRFFLAASLSAPSLAASTAIAPGALDRFLQPTKYIDSSNPAVVALARSIAGSANSSMEVAIRIHDHVRDRINFGFSTGFYDQKASDVMELGVGYCNTKGTLFIALLRAAGIPARQHFVNIDAQVLAPFVNPGTSLVDHSFAEVFVQDQWRSVDSYVVDVKLFASAKRQLGIESKNLGYAIHKNGQSVWDGRSDSFSQFVNDDVVKGLTTKDYGVFDDVGAFYESGNGVNKLNFFVKASFGLFSRSVNQRIESVRNAGYPKAEN